MRILELLSAQTVCLHLQAQNKQDLLRELAHMLSHAHPSICAEDFFQTLEVREKLGSTGLGEGVAIPHGKLPGLGTLVACLGISQQGIEFEAFDKKPSHLFFALVSPESFPAFHLKALARISRMFRKAPFRAALLAATTPQVVLELVDAHDV
ncbi:MAG: PTS sugar transporter subunit IIA [Proteobacteria bacterium]|nr:PTS sugar transporter subunit IIA [Cystobacterineae bacterium]MCL2259075.1 PTS sugar transporter subunit IIA [Cystobacterineae bacterium]MCL2314823.1 PTS sugar transporter subunit IIA [Pseudomonadota bacterium]